MYKFDEDSKGKVPIPQSQGTMQHNPDMNMMVGGQPA